MTALRFHRIPSDQPCQHPDCRKAPKGPRPACYQVEVGEARPTVRILCCAHGAALASEHGVQFPPVQESKP